MIKALKFITLPITIPLAFLAGGVIIMIAFVVLLFNNEKRHNLFGL